MKGSSHGDSKEEEQHDGDSARLEVHVLTGDPRWDPLGDVQGHDSSWHQPVDHGGDDELKELGNVEFPSLPHHEGCDVTKGAEGSPCISCYHDVDAAKGDELVGEGAQWGGGAQRPSEARATSKERRKGETRDDRLRQGREGAGMQKGGRGGTRSHEGKKKWGKEHG